MSNTLPTQETGFRTLEDLQGLQVAILQAEARLARINAQLSRIAWTGSFRRPDNWDDRRTVDAQPGDQVKSTIAEVVDPPWAGAALRNEKRLASSNPLTGIMGRGGVRLYLTKFARDLAMHGRRPASLMVMSIDFINSKRINDDYSQETGDALSRVFARTADRALRQLGLDKPEGGSIRAAHTGGDEFFLIGQRPVEKELRKVLFTTMRRIFQEELESFLASPEAEEVVTAHQHLPGVTLADGTFAFRFGYTIRSYPAQTMSSGKLVASIGNQFKAANLEAAKQKAASQKLQGAEFQDHRQSERGPEKKMTKPLGVEIDDRRQLLEDHAGGDVLLYGDPKKLVRSERTFRNFQEMVDGASKPVDDLHLDEPLARSVAPEHQLPEHQLSTGLA